MAKEKKKGKEQKISSGQVLFFLAPFLYGLYYEHLSMVASVFLLFLLWHIDKKKGLCFYINPVSVCIIIMDAGYFLSIFYAVDSGMAWIGFLKKLPVLFFLLLIVQFSEEEQTRLLEIIPLAGAVMTILGIAVYIFPDGREFFYIAGRLSGYFQYANTYAIFLLCGIMIKGWKEQLKREDYAVLLILLAGILLTGSRTVFLLLIPAVLILMIKNKQLRFFFPIVLGAGLVCGAIFAVITGNMQNIGRFLTISFNSSTFLGRLLYVYDAVPMLLKYPFGLGYHGYYDLQSEVQTGLYSVQYVHNGFLQIGLDAGIVPMLAGIFLALSQIFSKRLSGMKKTIFIFLCLHSLADFDMEYPFMAMLVVLCMNCQEGKEVQFRQIQEKKIFHILFNSFFAVTGAVCLYFFIPFMAYYCENYSMAASWFPYYTQAQLYILSDISDEERAEALADQILKQNKQATLAYDAKAMAAYIQDDYMKMIQYKKQAIKTDKFSKQEYEEYAAYLLEGIDYYHNTGNESKAEICIQALKEIPKLIQAAKQSVSSLGKKIRDQVDLELDSKLLQEMELY